MKCSRNHFLNLFTLPILFLIYLRYKTSFIHHINIIGKLSVDAVKNLTFTLMDRTNTIRKYLNLNIKIFQLLGLWPEQKTLSETSFLWRLHLVVMHVFFSGLFNFQQIIFLCLNDDFASFVLCGFSAISTTLISIKTYIFVAKYSLIRKIVDSLDDENFQPNNERQEENVRHNFRMQRWLNIAFMAIVTGIGISWTSVPLFRSYRSLPFYCWYPYDSKKPLYYEISLAHQLISAYYCCVVLVNIDMFAIALMIYIGVECDMVADTLRNIEEFARKSLIETPKMSHQSKRKIRRELVLNQMNNILIDCVRKHRHILKWGSKNMYKTLRPACIKDVIFRLSDQVSRFLNVAMFYQFSTSLCSISLVFMMVTVVSISQDPIQSNIRLRRHKNLLI